jgi:glutathione S-transferase
MKLRMSYTSPFARKCRIVALEAGLDDRLEMVPTTPWAADTDLFKDNPLCKVPALIADDGTVLYDSPVICDYLDSLHDGARLIPAAGAERWHQKRLEALADGMTDAAVGVRIETATRPEDKRWPHWVERQTNAVVRGLDSLEGEAAGWGDTFLIGQIAVLTALAYLDFRRIVEWRAGRPALAAWFETAAKRPSAVGTEPKE